MWRHQLKGGISRCQPQYFVPRLQVLHTTFTYIYCLSEVITEYLPDAILPECRSAEVVLAVQLVGLLVVVGVGGDVPDISQYRNTEYGEQIETHILGLV